MTPLGKNDRYLEPYRQSVRRHGTDFRVTLWANEASQQVRFEVFTQMCFLVGKRILDAGCGRGDLATYLLQKQIDFDRYVGVDGLDQVIEFARGRQLPNCRFEAGDFLAEPSLLTIDRPQIICISGALNTMADKQVFCVLESAWAAAGESLLFNFLPDLATNSAATQTQPARRLDALRLLKWAAGKTGRVVYRQDYMAHGHDATIMMAKEKGALRAAR